MLKKSPRNSNRICSRSGIAFRIDTSQLWYPGPCVMLRPSLPYVPGVVSLAKAQVFGISILDEKSKAKFAAKYDVNFPLLADANHDVAEKYGVSVWTAFQVCKRTRVSTYCRTSG